MYCTKCGWKNADDATKCTNCGADLAEQPATQPQPTQYDQQPAYQQPACQPVPEAKPSNTLSIIGIVLGAISLFFCPILFGPAGIILGGIGMSKKEKLGLTAIIVSACCMVVGIVIGVFVGLSHFRALQNMPRP